MELWVADGEMGLMRGAGSAFRLAGPPCDALCAGAGCVYCAGAGRCLAYHAQSGETLFDAAAPGGVCALQLLGGRLCALSSDADSVTAYSARTGDILFSAPAGMYPRAMCVSRRGKLLAVAGGASGSVLLLDDCLSLVREYRLPGTVCGVCLMNRGMAALCAVERGDICASLMGVSFRGVAEEWARWPLLPSCLCALPSGGCAVGCLGEAALLSFHKKITLRRPYPCPLALRPSPEGTLICDGCRGDVSLPDGRVLYRGKLPKDALLLPD